MIDNFYMYYNSRGANNQPIVNIEATFASAHEIDFAIMALKIHRDFLCRDVPPLPRNKSIVEYQQ